MIDTTHIQPLARVFNASVAATTTLMTVSTANAHALRVVIHTGTLTGTGTATIRVWANTQNNLTGAVQVIETATLAADSSYELLVSAPALITAKPGATHALVQINVSGTLTAQIAGEVAALPARSVPAALPTNWTRLEA